MKSMRAITRGRSSYEKCLASVREDELVLNISPSNNHKLVDKALKEAAPGTEVVHTYELSSPFDAEFPGSKALYEEFLEAFGTLAIPPQAHERDVVVFSSDENHATLAARFLAATGKWAYDPARDILDRGGLELDGGECQAIDPGPSTERVVSTVGYKEQSEAGYFDGLRRLKPNAVLDARWLSGSYPETWIGAGALASNLPGVAWHRRRMVGNPWLKRDAQGPQGWVALYTRYLERFGWVILPWVASLTPGHLVLLCREVEAPQNSTTGEPCHRILLALALVAAGLARPGDHVFPPCNARMKGAFHFRRPAKSRRPRKRASRQASIAS